MHNFTLSLIECPLLRYKGISDPVVAELANIKTTPELLYYLKARETKLVQLTSSR